MSAPAGVPMSDLHLVTIELVRLSVAGGLLAWRTSETTLRLDEKPDEAARRLAGEASLSGVGVVLHSTSWRYDDGPVLTYALFPDAPDASCQVLGQHVITGPSAIEPSPAQVGQTHVAAHAARHLADLATGRDPHVSQCATARADAWRLLLASGQAVHATRAGGAADHDHRVHREPPGRHVPWMLTDELGPRPASSVDSTHHGRSTP